MATPRLTSLSHGGGCGCKIAPGILTQLLKGTREGASQEAHTSDESVTTPDARPERRYADLLVGRDTSDDAAVYRLNDEQALISTTDFFMPIVDDPFDFGRIAACNALSDVYAMGGRPLLALAIVGMPINVLPHDVIRAILRGGETVCESAGIPIAGGHSIDSVEPIYGLAVTGVVDPKHIKRNSTARAGDLLVLGKPLGVGIFSAAFKKGVLEDQGYRLMIEITTQLNSPGTELSTLTGVHAMTDVTGFGLLGHLLEICRGSRLSARVRVRDLPLLPGVEALVQAGLATGASARNWDSYAKDVLLAAHVGSWLKTLLTDPQTSGGLLVACSAAELPQVERCFARHGFGGAAVIGQMTAGDGKVTVE